MKLSPPDFTHHGDHNQSFCCSSFKICPILFKHLLKLSWAAEKWVWTEFHDKKKSCVANLTRSTQNWFRSFSSAKLWATEMKCFIGTMIWGSMPKLGTMPPMGHEIWKMAILANRFWTVCRKYGIYGFLVSCQISGYRFLNYY